MSYSNYFLWSIFRCVLQKRKGNTYISLFSITFTCKIEKYSHLYLIDFYKVERNHWSVLLKSVNRISVTWACVPHFNECAYSEPLKVKRSLANITNCFGNKKDNKKDCRAVKHLRWAVCNRCTYYFEVFFKNFETHRQF